jgi:hypothetical protein
MELLFLPRRLHARKNPKAQQNNRAHHNPMRRHMHQVSTVNQSADQDHEPNSIKPE